MLNQINHNNFTKMEMLQFPEKYKPLPKAHLFLHKLRKINSIDRDIRLKWQKMQQQKSQQYQSQFKSLVDMQKLCSAPEYQIPQNSEKNYSIPNRIVKIRADIIRQQAHLRKKKYEEVYFKKNKRDHRPKIFLPLQKVENENIKQRQFNLRIKSQGSQNNSPIMLRKRKTAMQKQLSVIKNRYEAGIRAVSEKKKFLELKMWESQKDMLKKIQGTKFYYRLATSWEPTN